jgi:hypothetical protein
VPDVAVPFTVAYLTKAWPVEGPMRSTTMTAVAALADTVYTGDESATSALPLAAVPVPELLAAVEAAPEEEVVPLAAASADEELLPESLQAASARMIAQSAARLTAVFRMMMSPSTELVVGHHL